MGQGCTQCPSLILSNHTVSFSVFTLAFTYPFLFLRSLLLRRTDVGESCSLFSTPFHSHWSWLTFRILGVISNSDILNHLSCQEPIETASIKPLPQCCHPQESQAVRADGTPFSGLLLCSPSLSFLWQSAGHSVAKPSSLYGFAQIVYHLFSSLSYHRFSHLLSSNNSFKKIHMNNPYF